MFVTITRNTFGKFCWPDGTLIYKDRNESWVQAINQVVKQSNVITVEKVQGEQEEYEEIEVEREEDDASSGE